MVSRRVSFSFANRHTSGSADRLADHSYLWSTISIQYTLSGLPCSQRLVRIHPLSLFVPPVLGIHSRRLHLWFLSAHPERAQGRPSAYRACVFGPADSLCADTVRAA